jgi:hypothetical protein
VRAAASTPLLRDYLEQAVLGTGAQPVELTVLTSGSRDQEAPRHDFSTATA